MWTILCLKGGGSHIWTFGLSRLDSFGVGRFGHLSSRIIRIGLELVGERESLCLRVPFIHLCYKHALCRFVVYPSQLTPTRLIWFINKVIVVINSLSIVISTIHVVS